MTPGFLDRLRGKPPSPDELERRKHEKEVHETRKRELKEKEAQARYDAYSKARVAEARRRGYQKGVNSSKTLGERLGGFAKGAGETAHRVGHTANRELDELGRPPPQFKGRTIPRERSGRRRRRGRQAPTQRQPPTSLLDQYKKDLDDIMS